MKTACVKVLWNRKCGEDAALEEIQWVRCRGNEQEWGGVAGEKGKITWLCRPCLEVLSLAQKQ